MEKKFFLLDEPSRHYTHGYIRGRNMNEAVRIAKSYICAEVANVTCIRRARIDRATQKIVGGAFNSWRPLIVYIREQGAKKRKQRFFNLTELKELR